MVPGAAPPFRRRYSPIVAAALYLPYRTPLAPPFLCDQSKYKGVSGSDSVSQRLEPTTPRGPAGAGVGRRPPDDRALGDEATATGTVRAPGAGMDFARPRAASSMSRGGNASRDRVRAPLGRPGGRRGVCDVLADPPLHTPPEPSRARRPVPRDDSPEEGWSDDDDDEPPCVEPPRRAALLTPPRRPGLPLDPEDDDDAEDCPPRLPSRCAGPSHDSDEDADPGGPPPREGAAAGARRARRWPLRRVIWCSTRASAPSILARTRRIG